MKRKILQFLLAFLLIISLTLLTACSGVQGPVGPQGEQGVPGADGKDGADGEKGDKGDKGDTGEKGEKGDTGAQGEKGDKGDKGDTGEKGETGATGSQGEKGDKGDKGDTGEKGETGATGPQGEKGDDGVGIENMEINEDGELVITLTDGTVVNCGKVTACTHSYSEWLVIAEKSCTVTGIKMRTCSKCDYKDYEFTPAGHNYEDVVTSPTCGGEGYTTHTCSVCEDEYIDTFISATGEHNYVRGICSVCHADEPGSAGLVYEYDDYTGGYSLVSTGTCSDEFIRIPYTYEGSPVTKIEAGAIVGYDGLKGVEISDNVVYIAYGAFVNCNELETLITPFLGESREATSACIHHMFGCGKWSLTSSVPMSLTTLVLTDCTRIENYSFVNNTNIISLTVPESVISVSKNAFLSCGRLVEVYNLSSLDLTSYYKCENVVTHTSLEEESILDRVGDFLFATIEDTNYLVKYFGNDTVLTLPESYKGEEYVIYNYAFHNCSSLTSITIPSSITSIGNNAFSGCTGLTSIDVSEDNEYYKSIDGNIYSKNGEIFVLYAPGKTATSFTIPSSVTSIGYSAFGDCTGLTSITISEGVTSIDDYAFSYCDGLTSVTIPGSVTSIGNYAFSGCTGLTSITIPSSVTSIGNSAFYGCSGLTSVTISEGVESIGDRAFSYCDGLTSITIPNSVTSIGNNAFDGCTGLTSVTISEGVESIGDSAFSDCTSLTSITIPSSVTSIGNSAFSACHSLVEVYNLSSLNVSSYFSDEKIIHTSLEEESILEAVGDYVFMTWEGKYYLVKYIGTDTVIVLPEKYNGNDYAIYNYAFYNCDGLTSITIPEGVTSIGDYAFYNCYGLTSITIPSSVISIGDYAFYWCSSLTSVTISEGVESIGDSAFSHCDGLTSITIPEGVTSIGSDAFSWCTSLTSVTIPGSVTSIGDDAFSVCHSLVEVYNLSSLNVSSYFSDEKIIHTLLEEESILETVGDYIFMTWEGKYYLVKYIGTDTVIVLPEKYKGNDYAIYNYAFSDCTGLTSITIPNSVTSICDYAFLGCNSLTSITIPGSVTSIGERAFSYCDGLTSITILDGVTSIGNSAFSGCTGLTSITIPESVTSIGNNAFYGCTGLTSITIPESVTNIGLSAFEGCSNLKNIELKNTEGWWYAGYSNAVSGTEISSTDLSNTETAASYLTNTYRSYYWKRS